MNTKRFAELLDFLRRNSAKQLMLGFSGGADSSALLLLLLKAAPILKLKIRAIHFEHGIRGKASREDAAWCREFCRKRKIPFEIVPLRVPANQQNGESVEMAARRCRLEAWETLSKKYPDSAIALAHHADDRAENLFLRLMRGANASGLSSMRSVQKFGELRILRPLLSWRKAELLKFLAEEDVKDWREDASNSDESIPRNYLRGKLLPQLSRKFPQADGGITASLSALEADALFLEEEAARHFAAIAKCKRTSAIFWLKLPPPLRIRTLRLWLSALTGSDFIPNSALAERFTETLERLCQAENGEKISIPLDKKLTLDIQKGFCKLASKKASHPLLPIKWDWKRKKEITWARRLKIRVELLNGIQKIPKDAKENIAVFDAENFPGSLILRSSRDGDTMRPFGVPGKVRLKKLFAHRKISADQKQFYPLVCDPAGNILWIPGVRRSELLPVSKKTRKLVRLSIEELPDVN